MERKLLLRRFQPEEISQALDRLEEEGALSDRRFAEEWVRSRLRKHPEGRTLLEMGLRKRGVDDELSREVVKQCTSWPEYREALKKVYDGFRASGVYTPQQIKFLLQRKGFSTHEIRVLFEELG
ncbi:MAG: hypothetical protein Kow009_01990 [Spirochaetales bacterium]